MTKNYQINLDNFVWGSINKKVLLIKISKPLYKTTVFELKGIGLEIWKMLIKKYNYHKILENLTKKYPFHKKQTQKDFFNFIKELKKKEIINEIQ